MFLLYRVLFCNFANSSQICKTFLGLISCKCSNIVFFLSLLYVVFIFPPCKCKYCHEKSCNQINVILKKNQQQQRRQKLFLVIVQSAIQRTISTVKSIC